MATSSVEFHICLTNDTRPFCVNTPRFIPYAYLDKPKAKLDHLQAQTIITPSLKQLTGAPLLW